ncbi:MAG: hypothetical protein K0S46_63 [Moraxellaceae bacterium]|jgi:hypothetical protein|nr:hypothetical protein [Moraxellaceae bacterium]
MTRQGQPLRQALRGWLLAAFTLGSGSSALAQMDIAPLTVTRTVNWVGGDVVEQASFCVESFQEAPDKKSSSPIPYSINASIGGAATPFTLANGAGQTVPVTIAWTDVIAGSTSTLSPAVPTPETLVGRLAGCPGGNNGLLTLTVLNTSLGAMPAGTYTRTFSVEAANSGSGRARRAANVTLSVVIPAIIRVSNINDLVLGTFNGVSNMVASDTICIYKNGGALYGVTATGSGAAGAFTVANGASVAPYTVTWQDNVGTVALSAGVQAASRGNANTVSTTCGGGATDNATVTVTITAASLLGAMQPGLYSGVLTLMVIPQ